MATGTYEDHRIEKPRTTFPIFDDAHFNDDVNARVADYFISRQLSRKSNGPMVAKTVVLLSALFVPYALILTGAMSLPAMWICCVVMGFAMAGIGFSVGHDAQHGAYSANPRVNAWFGYTFELLGANGYMWRLTHNLIHHTYTQIAGLDEDIEVSPILRLSPSSKHLGIHRYQHLYAPFAYSLSLLNWAFVKDFDYFSRRRLGPYEDKKYPWSAFAALAFGKLAYYAWWLALPIFILPIAWWQVVVGFVTVNLIGGFILGIVFQLAHVVEESSYPRADADGVMENSWAEHQMFTTVNFAPTNRLLTWYVGGLNFQIEHHLFPKTCSVHYPALSGIVRETAHRHGLPYLENPTFGGAIRSHWRMLRRLGGGEVCVENEQPARHERRADARAA